MIHSDSDRKIAEKILQQVTAAEKQRVLEVGCGDGRISALLADRFASLTAIDPDQASITTAEREVSGATFQLGSGEQLSFPDNSFDIVIFTLSLHHQNSARALEEARRVLSHAGFILIVEPLPEGEVQQVFAFVLDENREKEAAQRAIRASDLVLEWEEKFCAAWSFADQTDLCRSIFTYYQRPFDANQAQKISAFVSEKADQPLIVLEDRMIIQMLRQAGEKS